MREHRNMFMGSRSFSHFVIEHVMTVIQGICRSSKSRLHIDESFYHLPILAI